MLYQPINNTAARISRHKLQCNRARLIERYRVDGVSIEIWRMGAQHYSGPAEANHFARAYQPVKVIQ